MKQYKEGKTVTLVVDGEDLLTREIKSIDGVIGWDNINNDFLPAGHYSLELWRVKDENSNS